MGNRITNRKHYGQEEYLDKSLKMSNGLTDVFISVLSLSASHLARTDAEIDFAIWLAAHDQSVVGSGAVGFDLSDLPWSAENFDAEKRFLLSVVDSARSKQYWDGLGYEPHAEWTLNSLEKFGALVDDFTKEFIRRDDDADEPAYKPPQREKCPTHNIYLHWAGCVICNDQ